jgi:hypothetical protein
VWEGDVVWADLDLEQGGVAWRGWSRGWVWATTCSSEASAGCGGVASRLGEAADMCGSYGLGESDRLEFEGAGVGWSGENRSIWIVGGA